MKIKQICIVSCLCGIWINTKAQIMELTLDRVIAIAQDSSIQAFKAKNVYMSSYWAYRSFKAARLPSLMLDMTPMQYNRDFTSRYDSENDLDVYRRQQSLYSSARLSLEQNLDITGGTFYVDSELGYRRLFGETTYNQFSTIPIRIGYSQPVLGFNEFKWQKKIEPLKYEKAKKTLISDLEQISVTSTQYFFNLAIAQINYDMAKDNVESTDTLYHIGRERQKITSISQSDLLTLKLDAINAKNTLKNAEIELKRAMFSLISFLKLDQHSQIRIVLPDRPKNIVLSPELALQYARKNNPDFLSNRQKLLEAQQEVEKTKRTSNLDASFNASIGYNQVASNFAGAYRKPLEQDIISIGIRVPLLDWGVRKGKANMARNNLNITKLTIEQQEQELEENILMTVNDFNVQQDLIASAEEALALANTVYETTKQRFMIGKADINSLTLSLNRQTSARNNYINALKQYWISYYTIRQQTLYDFSKQETLSIIFEKIIGL